jgi:hypothetical protein
MSAYRNYFTLLFGDQWHSKKLNLIKSKIFSKLAHFFYQLIEKEYQEYATLQAVLVILPFSDDS